MIFDKFASGLQANSVCMSLLKKVTFISDTRSYSDCKVEPALATYFALNPSER
ncbi:hypothetical protein N480_12540 [Pseudoalteromonas luteoviolacea S2607]|uniref:hypothetical protein n=1 Tax=Pseudoalteromonas luteoviolacea TaxID=43657 RepID=UPI0007B1638E|nr:hypothetical protein [Pseudoalteromonas luteoviolacea]KZN38474.1 hypothetical protein N480_12540 [Pseudoalteromonas luteoviolacea S2607]